MSLILLLLSRLPLNSYFTKCYFTKLKKWFKKYQHFSWHIFLILLSSAIQVFLLLSPMSCGEYNPSQIVSLSFFEVNTD